MELRQLQLTQYRNILDDRFSFDQPVTILHGPNGIGKTNVLEAIHLLSFPRSFRGSKDAQLIHWEQPFARVEGQAHLHHGTERSLVVFIDGGKQLQVDGQLVSANEFIGQFISLLFAPEEVGILAGSPQRRRSLLDAHLSQLSNAYFSTLQQYAQVLRRRNKLLAARASQPELDYWSDQQVGLGVKIIEHRLRGIERLNALLSPTLSISYSSSLGALDQPLDSLFHNKQASIRMRELQVGHSLLGPQRDDWRIWVLGQPDIDVGLYGSRGEQRMSVIRLIQAQLADAEQQSGNSPVLLLDDVLSELDPANQELLLSSLGQYQTFITSASLSDVPPPLLQSAQLYHFTDGHWST